VRPIQAGFTLFELMLVMVIILIASALTIPVIDTMMTDGRVKAARDEVRARWADIRGRAMQEGRAYTFGIQDNTGKYKIQPEDMNDPSDTDDPPLTREGELPKDVVFSLGQSTIGSNGGSTASSTDYQTIVVYLPDGTARDDVELMFGKSGLQLLGLQLRAITGTVTMIDGKKGDTGQ